ncbi:MAG: holo-ACP synthase [Dehalococcoidales bacterium]|nr:holo-ACP synthase [Dehalococcoidales bacterium]
MKHYTGIDIIEIPRIKEALLRWGERFLSRIYTEPELRLCRNKPNVLAVRFAGKEAVMKLLGTGVRGVCWRDIEILSHNTGKPFVRLSGGALKAANQLGLSDIAVSLSHSRDYAVASVFSTGVE